MSEQFITDHVTLDKKSCSSHESQKHKDEHAAYCRYYLCHKLYNIGLITAQRFK